MLSTIVVPNRNAWRHCRAKAALEGKHGVKLLTIDQLAARLAGGFLQPIDGDHVATAVGESVSLPLGELDAIKTLPGFQRAAVNSLSKAWSAGLSLDHEAKAARDQAARIRLEALALLEREVLARLPKNEMRPNDLVARALKRKGYARVLFGSIEIHGRTEMSPVSAPPSGCARHRDRGHLGRRGATCAIMAGFAGRHDGREGPRTACAPFHILRKSTA